MESCWMTALASLPPGLASFVTRHANCCLLKMFGKSEFPREELICHNICLGGLYVHIFDKVASNNLFF